MKLAAVYNIFDGEELLEYSINSIREQVDLIIVVYQVISNFGAKNNHLKKFLQTLVDKKLIDELIFYEPQLNKSAHFNEVQKRVIGAKLALKENCTHFIHMDSDELYDFEQFKKAKNYMVNSESISSVCTIYNYFKEPIYQMTPIEDFYVPFIQRIDSETSFAKPYPVFTDPTRTIAKLNKRNFLTKLWKKSYTVLDNVHVFKEDQLVMHHYSWVRKDILKKITNSTDTAPPEKIENFLKFWNTWKPGQIITKPVQNPRISYDVIQVENRFNISI